VQLDVGASDESFRDRARILGYAGLSVSKSRPRHDNVGGSAESCICDLKVEDLAREV
jgi:hypothetical protein